MFLSQFRSCKPLLESRLPLLRLSLSKCLDQSFKTTASSEYGSKINKVTKHVNEEDGATFYVTRRGAIDSSAPAESKAYPKAANISSIHSMRESLLEETEEDYYRRLALFALRNHGGEDAINVIIESLGVESSMIRIEAAFVLGQLESKTAIASLSKILRDVKEHPMVRVEAAKALGFIADEKSREVLQELSGDLDPIIAKGCDSSLSILEFKNSKKYDPLI
ncbi:ARM repeat superfamily protein [Arabidopsis thaliana]|uniref:ARM repeat superfamily protein n=1 Tax=Arabidopsis thaliana TaxID=3702 RepID=Q94K48_ARATH|nr:ARM repeat superfamily protein [Arabidopsis thaliana]AAK44118.1 unknown protein [Arabidopsis thaliana]AAL34264.1 unknown protein [Arabidopsis thaliana]AEE80361.1 ARM repeat superfamily protein [Arabidopsis thaliana]|eukprot:NP_567129.1 ARM repeat superfamily protein [Arabidopsis thaliana]